MVCPLKIQPSHRTGSKRIHPAYSRVDDDPDSRRLSVEVLVDYGYEVGAVKDGSAGWEALQTDWYDLIAIQCNIRDITECKRAERAQRRLEVMTALNQKLEQGIVRRKALEQALKITEPDSVELASYRRVGAGYAGF